MAAIPADQLLMNLSMQFHEAVTTLHLDEVAAKSRDYDDAEGGIDSFVRTELPQAPFALFLVAADAVQGKTRYATCLYNAATHTLFSSVIFLCAIVHRKASTNGNAKM